MDLSSWLLGLLGTLLVALLGTVGALWRKVEKADGERSIRLRVLEDDVRTLRRRSHEYGNWIEVLRSKCEDLERDVIRLRDGKNGR